MNNNNDYTLARRGKRRTECTNGARARDGPTAVRATGFLVPLDVKTIIISYKTITTDTSVKPGGARGEFASARPSDVFGAKRDFKHFKNVLTVCADRTPRTEVGPVLRPIRPDLWSAWKNMSWRACALT